MFRSGVLLLVCLAAFIECWELVSAPWTPFHDDDERSLHLEMVEKDAQFQSKRGVNFVWVVGGMGQWSTITVPERKLLAEEWVKQGHKYGLKIIVHVGHQCISDSQDLARHAEKIGADGVAVLPPYAPSKPNSLDVLVMVLAKIANEVDIPFYYYHMPGQTGLNYKMQDLLIACRGVIPTFAGIKYVSNDLEDFQNCLTLDGGKYDMMWAPEPKLQALPFGTTSFVLAESYYAPFLLDVLNAYKKGDMKKADEAQKRLNNLQSLIKGEAAKEVMKMLGIDLGPPRLPNVQISEQDYDKLFITLKDWGFFNSTQILKPNVHY
jgi:N-acetylneuraminate lyase